MGHLGRKPIRRAWYLVFFALVINYLGQGAFALTHPGRLEYPLRDGPLALDPPLRPFRPPLHRRDRDRVPGDDQRDLLHRLPGDHHPPAARCSGRVHLDRAPEPDLHRHRQLGPARRRPLRDVPLPRVPPPRLRLRTRRHRDHGADGGHDDRDLRAPAPVRPRGPRVAHHPARPRLPRREPEQALDRRVLVARAGRGPAHRDPDLPLGPAQALPGISGPCRSTSSSGSTERPTPP